MLPVEGMLGDAHHKIGDAVIAVSRSGLTTSSLRSVPINFTRRATSRQRGWTSSARA